jgi:Skp family chaperone for outer membrane proteins
MKWNGRQTVAATALICSFAASAARAEPSMAVLDLARVFEEYEMTRDLEEMFDQKRRAAAEEAEQRRASMDQMRRALAAFDPVSEDFARREEDLTRAQVDFEVWSGITEKRLKADHKKWLLKIYRHTQTTVAEIAAQRQIDLVLTYDKLTDDAPDSIALRQQILLQKVIYHSARIDITDEVLTRLNDSYRASGGIHSLQAPADDVKSSSDDPKPSTKNP